RPRRDHARRTGVVDQGDHPDRAAAPAQAQRHRVRRALREDQPQHLRRSAKRAAARGQSDRMKAALNPRRRVTALGYAVSVVAILALWQYGSSQAAIPLLFPSPLGTWRTALRLFDEGRLLADVTASLTRIAIGFSIGSVLGIVLG